MDTAYGVWYHERMGVRGRAIATANIIRAIEAEHGIVSRAAKRLKYSRMAIYERAKADPEVQQALGGARLRRRVCAYAHQPTRGTRSMSEIRRVDAALYRIPLPLALSDSTHHTITHFQLITATVTDADGASGLGYTYTVDSGGGAVLALIQNDLAPVVIGKEADRIEAIWQAMWWRLHFGGRGGQSSLAVSAIDIALWDLVARRANAPLWHHLGGFDPEVPCYAGGIDLDFPLDRLLAQADDFQAQGFRAIKMKVGRLSLRQDVERVAAMRRHLGDDFPLMADANMRWTADEAIRAARAVQSYGLVWLEEPTIPDDIAGQARIVREGGHPIAAGENLKSLWEFKQLIAAGGVTFPEPDVAIVGGVTVFMKVAALAEAFNLPGFEPRFDETAAMRVEPAQIADLEAHFPS